ncbi:putative glycosyltransferase [Burkholderiales bacterium]|nr:putative glycosyltransferase [Burkholderiales bacterium]
MDKPSVTVVIVNWNSGSLLADCLEYLARQTLPPARVLVMDNGSVDGSADCAGRFAGVTLRMLGKNMGFAAANNRAFDEVDTEFVALLNPDANAEPRWLERLLAAAKAHPDVAAFGSLQLMQGAEGKVDGLGDAYHFTGMAWRKGYGRRLERIDLVPGEIFAACGAAVLYRRDALLRAGGFDEDFFCYCEDVDLGFRLRLAGERCLFVPDAIVHHHGAATSGGNRGEFAVYHGHRNLVWTYVKDVPGLLFWVLLPLHVLFNAACIALFSTRGQGRLVARAKWDAIKGVPRAWAKRAEIQNRRVASIGQIWRAMDKRILPLR